MIAPIMHVIAHSVYKVLYKASTKAVQKSVYYKTGEARCASLNIRI